VDSTQRLLLDTERHSAHRVNTAQCAHDKALRCEDEDDGDDELIMDAAPHFFPQTTGGHGPTLPCRELGTASAPPQTNALLGNHSSGSVHLPSTTRNLLLPHNFRSFLFLVNRDAADLEPCLPRGDINKPFF
jgi:hypothetical protein